MLQISKLQFQAFKKNSRDRFEVRAAEYLKRSYPHERFTSDKPILARFIRAAIDMAAGYNITREVDVIRFFHLFVAVGGNFEVLPDYAWMIDYLREPIRAELRLDFICDRLRFGTGKSQ